MFRIKVSYSTIELPERKRRYERVRAGDLVPVRPVTVPRIGRNWVRVGDIVAIVPWVLEAPIPRIIHPKPIMTVHVFTEDYLLPIVFWLKVSLGCRPTVGT